jgi:exodeoxyribonuclease VII large subunit
LRRFAHLFDNAGVQQFYAVREIVTYLRELLESDPHLGDVWVIGEVSAVSRPASGHVYFTMKDADTQMRCVFFANRAAPAATTSRLIENGTAIAAHGRVGLYTQRGDLQFYVDFVQPEGAGALQLEFERLKAKLSEEGLFDELRKRPLPRFPGRIGVVTSGSGAAFHDICHVLERRWPLAELVLAPTPVQGPEAPDRIVAALGALYDRDDIDVIIAGRGGGSPEELAAFNNERVARALFASPVPVVSAVGHETDTTIADFVADQRAPTPSAAAELVAPDRIDVTVRLGVAAATMESLLRGQLNGGRDRLRMALHRAERTAPDVNRDRQRTDELTRRAQGAAEHLHRNAVQGVGGCVWRLKALDPYATLDRGYAIVQREKTVVSSVRGVKRGDDVNVRVRDGVFVARVEGGSARGAKRRPRKRIPEAQAPLFTMPEERA